jgi:hypothetical protein
MGLSNLADDAIMVATTAANRPGRTTMKGISEMTKNNDFTEIGALLAALADEPDHWSSAGTIYIGLGMDMGRYRQITGLMAAAGLIELTAETIRLTPEGLRIGQKINANTANIGA